jgi:hypothetical protein
VDEYIVARNALIEKDFIAFDGRLFQVLSLPEKASRASSRLLRTPEEMADFDPATIHQSIRNALRGD